MRSAYVLVLVLFGLQFSVKVTGQAIQTIIPKTISLSHAFTRPPSTKHSSHSSNMSCYSFSYFTRDERIPEPLFVIDGKQASSEKLTHISPNDIKEVEVVKDSQATVLYGQQGINGVIIITTKRRRSK